MLNGGGYVLGSGKVNVAGSAEGTCTVLKEPAVQFVTRRAKGQEHPSQRYEVSHTLKKANKPSYAGFY